MSDQITLRAQKGRETGSAASRRIRNERERSRHRATAPTWMSPSSSLSTGVSSERRSPPKRAPTPSSTSTSRGPSNWRSPVRSTSTRTGPRFATSTS